MKVWFGFPAFIEEAGIVLTAFNQGRVTVRRFRYLLSNAAGDEWNTTRYASTEPGNFIPGTICHYTRWRPDRDVQVNVVTDNTRRVMLSGLLTAINRGRRFHLSHQGMVAGTTGLIARDSFHHCTHSPEGGRFRLVCSSPL